MRVLVTGASGQLGGYLLRELQRASVDLVAWSGSRSGEIVGVPIHPVDLADSESVVSAFRAAKPTVLIHAGAMASVADCHRNRARARTVNTRGTELLAELAASVAARFVYVSTDLVFDGEKGWYRESDAPSPQSVYGRSKADAERAVQSLPNGVVARVSLLYGPSLAGRPSFFDQQLTAVQERRPFTLFSDEWRTPLDLATAARALAELARSDFPGTLHIGGPERMSRFEMGQRIARCLNLDPSVFVPMTRAAASFAEPRPRDTSLDSSRWRELFPELPWHSLEHALREMLSPA